MTSPPSRLVVVLVAFLAAAAPAAADVRTAESREGVQFTLSGTELTVTATPKATRATRRALQQPLLVAYCLAGIAYAEADVIPPGGFAFVAVGNVLASADGVLRTTLKHDISATVDLCGVEESSGSDISLAGFTEAGRRSAEGMEAPESESPAQRRLDRALRAALAERDARGGRFPASPKLRRAIIRRTGGRLKVRLARRLAGVTERGGVYIVGRTRAQRLTLATRTDVGTVLGIQFTREGIGVFERESAPAASGS